MSPIEAWFFYDHFAPTDLSESPVGATLFKDIKQVLTKKAYLCGRV